MKAKLTLMCAVVLSMAAMKAEAGYGDPGSDVFPDIGESQTVSNPEPTILASNVEFQRKVETQTTLIQSMAERRRKMQQRREAEYLERKKEMRKKTQ